MAVSREMHNLLTAAGEGRVAELRALFSRYSEQADELAKDPRLLIEAAAKGQPEIVEALLERGADVNGAFGKERALHRAIQPRTHSVTATPPEKQREVVELLLERGAELEARGGWPPVTPVALAAVVGSRELVEVLLKHGARTDFYVCCVLGRIGEVAPLLDTNRAMSQARDVNSMTALHYTAASRLPVSEPERSETFLEIARRLLDAGAEVNATATVVSQTLHTLYWACTARNVPMIWLLLERGADATQGLSAAMWNGTVEMAEMLVEAGARLNEAESAGVPLLYDLVYWGQFEKAEWMLRKGANPDVRDGASGEMPLHAAARRGGRQMVRALLHQGADINAKNKQGRTPIEVAYEHKQIQVTEVLEKHGAEE